MAGKIYTVYKAVCGIDGGVYIGMTGMPLSRRVSNHKSSARDRSKAPPKMRSAIKRYGFDSFAFSAVAQCKSLDNAMHIEAELISSVMDNTPLLCLNTSPGFGRQSPEHIEKLRLLSLGRAHSASAKELMRAAKLGKKASDETRAKLSKLRKGRTDGNYRHEIYKFHHEAHGTVETTMRVLINEYNLDASTIKKMLNGKRSHHKGWKIITTEVSP